MKNLNLNSILTIVGFTVLIYCLPDSYNSNNDKHFEKLEVKIDSLTTAVNNYDFDGLKDSIKTLKHEIEIFTIDSTEYINTRDSLRAKYNPR